MGALCVECHRGIHWIYEHQGTEWKDIKQYQKNLDTQLSKARQPYDLSDEQRETKNNRSDENETVRELRKRMFGEECSICGVDDRILVIHRKDGRPHKSNFLMKRENLEALDTDEWVSLCQKCHKYVHWAEEKLGLSWDDFETGGI